MSQSTRYYVYLSDQVQGPYEVSELMNMGLSDDSQVCTEGTTDWIPLKQLKDDPLSNFVSSYSGTQSSTSIPEQVGKYTVVSEIGQGGMGAVYLAIDKILNRQVAIKELKIDDHKKKDPDAFSTMIRRFQKEAQILAQLNHKNIVSVYDVLEQNGNQYIIMEYLKGKDLEQILEDETTLSIENAVSVISDVCLALDYIHQRSIIHRDIKPSNILILEDGVVKLTDFGVTRDLNSMTMTVDGSLVGTIAYASPEQDSRQIDGRSDVFSLGVVLYELLTGQKPFTGDTIASVLLKIATKEPIKPSEINPKIHKMLENIIAKAMAKNPAKRYATAMEFHNDLVEYKNALASNNVALLSGMKTSSDSVLNATSAFRPQVDLSVKPPAKEQQPIPQQNLFNKLPNLQDAPKPGSSTQNTRPGAVTQPGRKLSDTNTDISSLSVNPAQIANKVENLINTQDQKVAHSEIASIYNIKEEDVLKDDISNILATHSPLREETLEKNDFKEKDDSKTSKTSDKLKIVKPIPNPNDKEKKDKLIQLSIAASLFVISLILMFVSVINSIDVVFIAILIALTYYDTSSGKPLKPLSYLIILLGSFSDWFISKSLILSMDSAKFSPVIFYVIDASLLVLGLVISMFVLKLADNLASSKNKTNRVFSGLIKSVIIILSLIFSTSIIGLSPSIQTQVKKSKVAEALTSIVPNFKLGEKSKITFGKINTK